MARRGRVFPPRYARRMARGGKMGCAFLFAIPLAVTAGIITIRFL